MSSGKKNKLIAIGHLGCMTCYLNVSEKEAIRRFNKENYDIDSDVLEDSIKSFEFDDQFEAYDVDKTWV